MRQIYGDKQLESTNNKTRTDTFFAVVTFF